MTVVGRSLHFVAQTPGEQLAEQSREAAGESTEKHLKESPSVRFISRVTGLSMHGAFWLGQLFNFGLIAFFIAWASKKNLPSMFRSRTVSIQKAMAEARKASDDANRRLSEIEARLSRLDVEIGEMRMAAEREAAAEEERIKAATIEDAHRILESAEQEIAAAAKSARRDLTAYAADLAVSLAKKQIRVDPSTDEMLVRGFADQLSTTNGSGPTKARS
jgi:F-type H+-transporting ATPase subunit b